MESLCVARGDDCGGDACDGGRSDESIHKHYFIEVNANYHKLTTDCIEVFWRKPNHCKIQSICNVHNILFVLEMLI